MDFAFRLVMRGYDRGQVDQLIGTAQEALASDDAPLRAAARRALETPALTVTLRGYDRAAVEEAIEKLRAALS